MRRRRAAAAPLQKGLPSTSYDRSLDSVHPVMLRREITLSQAGEVDFQKKLAFIWNIFWPHVN